MVEAAMVEGRVVLLVRVAVRAAAAMVVVAMEV
jgi:hypothetical protein